MHEKIDDTGYRSRGCFDTQPLLSQPNPPTWRIRAQGRQHNPTRPALVYRPWWRRSKSAKSSQIKITTQLPENQRCSKRSPRSDGNSHGLPLLRLVNTKGGGSLFPIPGWLSSVPTPDSAAVAGPASPGSKKSSSALTGTLDTILTPRGVASSKERGAASGARTM